MWTMLDVVCSAEKVGGGLADHDRVNAGQLFERIEKRRRGRHDDSCRLQRSGLVA